MKDKPEPPVISFERCECNVCWLPCRIEIVADDSRKLNDKPRFVDRICPCREDISLWVRVSPEGGDAK